MDEVVLVEEESGPTSSGNISEREIEGVKTATFYQWKYSHYFVVVEEGVKNMRARCTLCAPSRKPLSSARNTTSNFKKHLETVHKTVSLVPIIPAEGKRTSKRKRSPVDEGEELQRQPKKQSTLLTKASVSPAKMRNLVAEYIINDMLPLSTVESPGFKKLIADITSSSVELPNRKALATHLDKAYELMISKIKVTLEAVCRVSTTADVWTGHNKSYLGMTVHWIDESSLMRQKAAIACTRVIGRHTYDVLAAKIEQIHEQYGLVGKISATITDNGSNFVKAFATFGMSDSGSAEPSITSLPTGMEDDEENEEEVTFENLDDLITLVQGNEEDSTQLEYELPPHERCAAHTLNLVASTDVDKYLSSSTTTRSVYRSSFAKCSALWNKARRSTVASDNMQDKLKRKLLVPSPTRWNSYYDAVLRVVENSLTELNEVCVNIEIRCFSERELGFLKEYCAVLKPLSRGLDILQGEDNCYYGALLPTLATIIKKTKALKPDLSIMTTGLADAIESSIKKRFRKVFDSKDAVIAAVTSPKFKLKWVESQETKDRYKQMLLDEMRLLEDDVIIESTVVEAKDKEKKRDFYEFESDDDDQSANSTESEVMEYLSNAKTLECLHKHPKIKRLFLKFNTTLPSSAPVERLFSLGSLVLTPKRSRLTDGTFEKLLLMRYNKKFIQF